MSEVIGIDHIYLAVSELATAEHFYDKLLGDALEFRKKAFAIDGEPHLHYYNRQFGFVLRPARSADTHDPYAPGLHHFCLRVESAEDVRRVASRLGELGLSTSEPKLYQQYAPDYVAIFLEDPDGIRLEVTNYRNERRMRHDRWDELSA